MSDVAPPAQRGASNGRPMSLEWMTAARVPGAVHHGHVLALRFFPRLLAMRRSLRGAVVTTLYAVLLASCTGGASERQTDAAAIVVLDADADARVGAVADVAGVDSGTLPVAVGVTTVNVAAPQTAPSLASIQPSDLQALVAARQQGQVTPLAQQVGCDLSALLVFDQANESAAANLLCLHGRGSLNLASVQLSTNQTSPEAATGQTWQDAAAVVWPGTDAAMLWPQCTAVVCAPKYLAASAVTVLSATDPRQKVSIYGLQALTDTWNQVSQFAVSDHTLDETGRTPPVSQVAPTVDFVWSGDDHPDEWSAAHPAMLIGHYQSMNAVQNGNFARCSQTSDCSLPGYSCAPATGASFAPNCTTGAEQTGQCRDMLFFAKEVDGALVYDNICTPQTSALKSCTTNADCPSSLDPTALGTCSSNKTCVLSNNLMQRAEYNYWQANHPRWILYRSPRLASNPCPATAGVCEENVAWNGASAQLPLDLTNPDVLTEIFDRTTPFVGTSSSYSVLSLDVVRLVNYESAYGVVHAGNSTITPLFTGSGVYNTVTYASTGGFADLLYTQAVLNWLQRLTDEMHARSLRLVVNLSTSGASNPVEVVPPGNAQLDQLFQEVDGVFDEGGFTLGNPRQTVGGCAAWRYDRASTSDPFCTGDTQWINLSLWSDYGVGSGSSPGYMDAVQALGKPYFTKNAVPAIASDVAPPGWVAPTPDPYVSMAFPYEEEWMLASYLMAKQHNASLYITRNPDGGGMPTYPQTTAVMTTNALGHPCGSLVSTPGSLIVSRQFQHGLVLVNPSTASSTAAPTFTLDGNAYLAWDVASGRYDSPVSNPIAVPYQQGKVLYTTTQLCP